MNFGLRLDKILEDHREWMRGIRTDRLVGTSSEATKQALTSLIKELVAEAKPEMPYEKLKSCPVCGEPQYNHSGDVHFDYGVNQYEENLLKELEEL